MKGLRTHGGPLAVVLIMGLVPRAGVADGSREVKIVVAASDASASAISKSLSKALSFIALEPQFERAASVDPRSIPKPSTPAYAAHLWVDASAASEVALYLTDAGTTRVFVRRIALDRGLDTVAVELVAFVAQSSLEALLAGKPIGVTRDDYEHSLELAARPASRVEPPPAERIVPPVPEATSTNATLLYLANWHLGTTYALQAWDSNTLRHEADVSLAYDRGRLRYAVSLLATWPIHFQSGNTGATLLSSGARLSMSRPFPISSRLRLLPGFGFGIEFTHIRPELGNPNDQPASPYFAIDPVVRPELGLEHAWSHASLRLTVGLDIAMHGVQYVVTRQAQTELVRTPWRERPFVAITVSAPP